MFAPDVERRADQLARDRRVLMVVDAVGGVWRYGIDLAAALQECGITTLLAVLGPAPSPAQLAEAQTCCARVVAMTCRLEWMDEPWQDVERSGEWLLELERAWQPDVVHLNGYAHASLPWHAPAIVVAHSCVCSWWRAVHGVAAPSTWREYRQRVGDGLQHARLVIAPTHAMRDALEREYGPVDDVRVIPNGRREHSRTTIHQRPKELFVLAAGRLWDRAKNVETLCTAAAALRWPVYVAGDASLGETPPAALPNVHHLGSLPPDQMQEWMARAAVYALPARYEPFGLSILEAAAAGCAPVVSDIASLRENWDGAAVFVPPDDTAALTCALERLIDDNHHRTAIARAAFARSRGFSAAQMASRYAAAYGDAQAAVSQSIASGGSDPSARP